MNVLVCSIFKGHIMYTCVLSLPLAPVLCIYPKTPYGQAHVHVSSKDTISAYMIVLCALILIDIMDTCGCIVSALVQGDIMDTSARVVYLSKDTLDIINQCTSIHYNYCILNVS